MRFGSDPDVFFRLTPRLFDLAVAGRAEAARYENDRRIEAAYLTAVLGRAKKPPRLEELLSPKKPVSSKPADWRKMLAIAEVWAGSAQAVV